MVGIASALEQNQIAAQRPAFGQGANAAEEAAANNAQARAAQQTEQASAAGQQNDPNAAAPTQAGGDLTLTSGFLSPRIQFDQQTSQVLFQFRDFETGDVVRQVPPQQVAQAFVAAGAEQGTPPAPSDEELAAAEEEAAVAAPAPGAVEGEGAATEGAENEALAPLAAEGGDDAEPVAQPAPGAVESPDEATSEEDPANPVSSAFTAASESTGEQAVATAGAAGPQAQPGPQETTPITGAQSTPDRVDTIV
ncbi:MAG: hypothetical protein NXI16_12230 [Alphaproteobacteria bacterium]|nr:hypothetical protein [Alphaproteobacteria bacterium]